MRVEACQIVVHPHHTRWEDCNHRWSSSSFSNCCNLEVVININVILRCLQQLSYGTKNLSFQMESKVQVMLNTTVICCLYSQMRNAKFLVEVSENTGVIPSHLTPVQIDEHLLLLLLNSYCWVLIVNVSSPHVYETLVLYFRNLKVNLVHTWRNMLTFLKFCKFKGLKSSKMLTWFQDGSPWTSARSAQIPRLY